MATLPRLSSPVTHTDHPWSHAPSPPSLLATPSVQHFQGCFEVPLFSKFTDEAWELSARACRGRSAIDSLKNPRSSSCTWARPCFLRSITLGEDITVLWPRKGTCIVTGRSHFFLFSGHGSVSAGFSEGPWRAGRLPTC